MSAMTLANQDYDLPSLFQLAGALAKAPGFIPAHLRSEGEIVAVILAGRELGLPPMAAMRSISLIKGKVIIDASMQLALMVRAGAKVRWLADGTDGKEAVLEVTREGSEPHTSRYTWEMAQQAGLTSNDTWKKHPAAMLRARCVSAAGRAYMPDVLAGVYVPGEIDDEAPSMPRLHVTGEAPRSAAAPMTQPRPAPLPAPAPAASEPLKLDPVIVEALGQLEAATREQVEGAIERARGLYRSATEQERSEIQRAVAAAKRRHGIEDAA